MNKDPFKEDIKESEPAKREKGYAWHTAIGLQAVDGLKTSEYLVHTAIRNIEGEISFEEANVLLQTYYEENPICDASDRTEEADKVSARIAALLSERAFSFRWTRSSTILCFLFPDCGRSMFLERATQERRRYSSSSICAHWALM